ncbi:MAG: hypothetical protein ABFR89_13245, partial [Actinomycetota bacterium]
MFPAEFTVCSAVVSDAFRWALHRDHRRQIGGTQMQGADMRKTLVTAFVVGLLTVVMAVPA